MAKNIMMATVLLLLLLASALGIAMGDGSTESTPSSSSEDAPFKVPCIHWCCRAVVVGSGQGVTFEYLILIAKTPL